jgi:hypothetical protein
MNALKIKIIALHCLLFVIQLYADDFFTPPLQQTRCFNRIIFVEDAQGNQFVLKYPRNPNCAVNDALGAIVGKFIGTSINDVQIFPPQTPSLSSVDKYPHKIKTLHTLVPGNEVKKLRDVLGYFSIKTGLTTKEKLRNIVKYKDLCNIIALDIFLNNGDRHNGNIFYDKENNRFYAIDMDAIFRKKRLLAVKAHKFLEHLNTKKLTYQEKTALKNLSQALHALIKQYPPKTLCLLKKSLAAEAGYTYPKSEQKAFRKLVEHNFEKIKQLQKQLKQVTKK